MSGISALSRPLTTLVAVAIALSVMGVQAAAAAETVSVAAGESIQDAVDANPPGTSFVLGAGVHREQQVVPSDGDSFTGVEGTVLSGAKILSGWEQTGDTWSVGGQTQEGLPHGEVLDGFEGDLHPEDLWRDGVRLAQVVDPGALDGDSWFFDYEADRIHVTFDPASYLVETSTKRFAFAGANVWDVSISNLTVTKYATPAQGGAIGGHYNDRDTRHWTLDRITAIENHAYGIIVAPGMTVTRSLAARNGQSGIGGSGTGQDDYTAPVVVRDSEIAENLTLGYDWWWEGGGTKFSLMTDMTFSNNYVHHNGGPGIWFDVYNTGATITDNLVEYNDAQGIFYEISSGAEIARNTVRHNSVVGTGGFYAAGIDLSQSDSTTVSDNVVYGQTIGVVMRHNGKRIEEGRVTNNVVTNNDITVPGNGINGMIVENTSEAEADALWNAEGNGFNANTIRVPYEGAAVLSWGTNYVNKVASWSFDDEITVDTAHPETTGTHSLLGTYGAGEGQRTLADGTDGTDGDEEDASATPGGKVTLVGGTNADDPEANVTPETDGSPEADATLTGGAEEPESSSQPFTHYRRN